MEAIGAPAKMTKQSAARQQVLELIERLGVGTAIPSERQLSVDLGVSRLTVRAALDDLAREGYLVRRRGSGTYVQQPKISQQLTMTSFSEDMRRRGMAPSSTTLSLTRQLAGPRLARFLNVSPGDEIVVVKRLRLADGVSMAIETLHIPAGVVPGVEPRDLEGSFYELLRTRYGVEIATATQTIEPTVTQRRGVGRARGAAPFACLPLRAHEPRRKRPDPRVRPLDLPRRSLPDRLRADALVTPPTPDLDKSGLVWEIPRVADWYRPLDAGLDVTCPLATDTPDAPLTRRRIEGDLA